MFFLPCLDEKVVDISFKWARSIDRSDGSQVFDFRWLHCFAELPRSLCCHLKHRDECSILVDVLPDNRIVLLHITTVEVFVKEFPNVQESRIRIALLHEDPADAILHVLEESETQEVELQEAVVLQVAEVHALRPRCLKFTSHTDDGHIRREVVGIGQ